jgi:DNA mismatch endonuclease (patch repair protein)
LKFIGQFPSRAPTHTDEARSRNMRAVRGEHTKPELAVRRAAHGLGLRFRLFRSDLPGRPDVTFPKWRTVLFVNGCFWHQHPNCPRSRLPKTNKEFWKTKLEQNAARDQSNYDLLAKQGWRVLVVWECELAHSSITGMLKSWFRTAKKRTWPRADRD